MDLDPDFCASYFGARGTFAVTSRVQISIVARNP